MTKTIAILITKILNQRNLFLSWLEKKKIEEDPPKNPFFILAQLSNFIHNDKRRSRKLTKTIAILITILITKIRNQPNLFLS